MQNYTISVIVPCYNAEDTIERCLLSLLNQTYPITEILVFNDGSQDKSRDVLDSMYNEYHSKGLRVFHQKNQGVSATRNQGLRVAQGEYISFIDADDFVETTFFEDLIKPYLTNNNLSLSVMGIERSNKKVTFQSESRLVGPDEYFEEIFKNLDVKGYPWNKLYKKDILISNNIYFDTQLSVLEDLEFNLRYCQYVRLVSLNSKKSYHYIIQDNSTMTSPWSDKKLSLLDSFSKMEKLSFLSKSQLEMVEIEKVRMLIWLVGQLYRTGDIEDIKKNEEFILTELSFYKRLFLIKGRCTGLKYYLSYCLFCIFPKSLKYLAKATR